MNVEEFSKLSCEYDLIPVYREVLADIDTPVSVLARFANDSEVFLLESVEGNERFGRYSFCGIRPRGIFTIEDDKPYFSHNGKKELLEYEKTPLFALRKLVGNPRIPEIQGMPPLFGGAIGYIGYETIGEFEEVPCHKGDNHITTAMMLTDEMIVFDNLRHTVKIVVSVRPKDYSSPRDAYNDAQKRIENIIDILKTPHNVVTTKSQNNKKTRFQSNVTKEEFCSMVERAKEHIYAGDIIQIVLSQKFTSKLETSPLQIYRALRLINPSPYTFFLRIGERILVGSSPETMVKLENGNSSLRPIAGTRKRGLTPEADRKLADELLRDEKERSEHLMLVDLGRNDLGRVAVAGSVQVKAFMNVEKYSHVMHLVSDVDAVLSDKYDAFDLVKATFPAGTLSGAPKIKAMELINKFEAEARGVYGGAVGYFSNNGNLDLAIAIRTIEINNDNLYVQAGAGIVFDSDPESEYEETINKAKAIFKAVELANNNLEIN